MEGQLPSVVSRGCEGCVELDGCHLAEVAEARGQRMVEGIGPSQYCAVVDPVAGMDQSRSDCDWEAMSLLGAGHVHLPVVHRLETESKVFAA